MTTPNIEEKTAETVAAATEQAQDTVAADAPLSETKAVVEPAKEEPVKSKEDQEAESFKALFEASLVDQPDVSRGHVVTGEVVAVESDAVIIDVGSKAEGRVSFSEFLGDEKPVLGQQVEVLVISSDNSGGVKLSLAQARRRKGWDVLDKAMEAGELIDAVILREVKGGYRVDISGLEAFMPKSEADIDVRMPAEVLLGKPCKVSVLSATRRPENVVVSRKQPMLAEHEEKRASFFAGIKVGGRVKGSVKRLADFGAFIDLGGVDALLHVSDMAWHRVSHPSELLTVGQEITAEIMKLNAETGKVSLSMRVLQEDPWGKVAETYEAGMRLTATVSRLLPYGAMVELEPGVEGMIHRSELSWVRREVEPSSVFSEGDTVDVEVLEVSPEKRRIALSYRAVQANPWQSWLDEHPVGTHVTGAIRNIQEFGMFVGLDEGLDGLVHLSNFSWTEKGEDLIAQYQKGQEVECVVLGVDVDRQRISLGIKQLAQDPLDVVLSGGGRGYKVTGVVEEILERIVLVKLSIGITAVLPNKELPREQDALKIGDEIEAKVMDADKRRRRVVISVRQFLRDEERDVVRQYAKKMKSEEGPSALALELQRKLLIASIDGK